MIAPLLLSPRNSKRAPRKFELSSSAFSLFGGAVYLLNRLEQKSRGWCRTVWTRAKPKLWYDENVSGSLAAFSPSDVWAQTMLGNDVVGDCTFASKGHQLMMVTANTGSILIPTTAQILAACSDLTGYDPSQTQPDGSNPTDQGNTLALKKFLA